MPLKLEQNLMWILPPVVGLIGGFWAGLSGPGDTRLTFLSVGQGDCAVFRSEGRTILIDAGPAGRGTDAGAKIIVPKLRQMGVSRVDLILLSHPDADHVGGTGAILEAYPGARIGISAVFQEDPKMRADLARWHVSEDQVTWLPSKTGLTVGGTTIRIRCPEMLPGAIDNDGSMCLRLQTGSATAVFSGDAPVSVEEKLVHEDDWSGEVMKAGHHGSRTATGDVWVKAVHPQWAILSCGRDNPYGHPHQAVVTRLEKAGISIARTDLDGDVDFSIRKAHFERN